MFGADPENRDACSRIKHRPQFKRYVRRRGGSSAGGTGEAEGEAKRIVLNEGRAKTGFECCTGQGP